MPMTFKEDVTGKKFNMLTAIRFLPDKGKFGRWLFRCDCGNEKAILIQSVKRGLTQSCGCFHREMMRDRKQHGHAGKWRTKTYNSWAGMMDRCEWLGHPNHVNYHGKGIRVDPRWHSYENFLKDMGERPENTSIDRIDNNKGYGPDNCRWATQHEQMLNTSRTIKVLMDGEVVIVYNLCEKLGINRKALRSRAVRRGYDYVAALRSFGIECEAIKLSA